MSLQQVAKVWDKVIGDGKLQQTLLALANRADEHGGNLYPSLDYLAHLTELHKSTVRRHICKLVDIGVLEVVQEATPRFPALYLLRLDKLPYKKAWRGTNLQQSISEGYQNHEAGVPNNSKGGTKLVPDPVKDPLIDPIYVKTAKLMYLKILELNPKYKEPNYDKWANTIRLMVERDKYTIVEIEKLFKWANDHHFWKINIRSPEKLRKHWDRMTVQMNNDNESPPPKPSRITRAANAIKEANIRRHQST